jgi:Skp family chaperone for outer membrane proteins
LKQIIDHKRNSLVDKYKGAYTEENAKKADEEVKVFMDKLQDRFDEMGKNRLVLLKDVVLGGHSVDVTDKLISYADGNSESKGGRTGK